MWWELSKNIIQLNLDKSFWSKQFADIHIGFEVYVIERNRIAMKLHQLIDRYEIWL